VSDAGAALPAEARRASGAVLERLTMLAALMRAGGVRVGTGEIETAARALRAIDASRRGDAYLALRAVLCSKRSDHPVFEAAFSAVFGEPGGGDGPDRAGMPPGAELVLPRVAAPPPEGAQPNRTGDAEVRPAAFSEVELLRDKDFAAYTDVERAQARSIIMRLAQHMPMREARRTRATRRRGVRPDLQATVRASLRHAGEPLDRRWRAHVPGPRKLVLVCDVSGSMAPYARMLLHYVQAIVATQAHAEAFVFGTRLTRLTAELAGRDPDGAIRRATDQAADWSGGTRIGAALAQLNREHGRRVGRGALVVVLSDGWDHGDPAELSAELARLSRCAHRVVWLSPPAADPQYEPLTRGMRAALPHVDCLMPGNSMSSLEDLADLLGAGLQGAGAPGAPRTTTS
jgi:uncharacterized protein with von Willebrand factor type A (vWA) domain